MPFFVPNSWNTGLHLFCVHCDCWTGREGGTLFCVSCLMPGPQLNADGIVFRHDEQFVSQLNTMTHAGSSALFIDNAAACVLCRRMHQCCLVHWWWSDREFLSICRTVKFGWDPLSVLARHYKLSFLSHLSHFENLPLDWHLHLILSMLSVMWMWTFVAEMIAVCLNYMLSWIYIY